jgi:hypothetical protein
MWSKWRGNWAWIKLSSGFDDLSQRPVQQFAPDIRRAIYTTNRKRFAGGRVRNFSRFAMRAPRALRCCLCMPCPEPTLASIPRVRAILDFAKTVSRALRISVVQSKSS